MQTKSAALEWSKLKYKLDELSKYMVEETEKHDHVISRDMFNNAVIKVLSSFEDLKAIGD